ncbi:MAG: glucosamine-6-phosphate deaminase [Candidatus Aminicenantes bacterium]|nr:MAG: glucosamine-6-phosphate deaminase [Candidatus Aminicenantes bacterium]
MEIIILTTKKEVYAEASSRVVDWIHKKPDAVLGLATGKTMLGVYKDLISEHKKGRVDFSSVKTINLDEYLGLDPGDPLSFHSYMDQNFFRHVNVEKNNTLIPDPLPEDVETECEAYEEAIRDRGGIDIQLLGIGRDGHIGFNEPSSSLQARTRVKTLTDETLKDNFGSAEGPRFAITMGIGTIMDAKEIILVAVGKGKAKSVSQMVEGPITASCPASALQLHPKVKVILDSRAAQLLKRKDYYMWVWKHKNEVEEHHLLYHKK